MDKNIFFRDWMIPVFAALCLFGANLHMMAPSISAGDSAELSTAQLTLGIAHSPGYPLFVLAGKLFSLLMPLGHPAYRTNLFSVACSFLGLLIFYRILLLWSHSFFLAISASFFVFMVPAIREQFVSTEVFALNFLIVLFVILLISLVWKSAESPAGQRFFYFISFVFGLGLGNQHTLILLLPSFIIFSVLLLYGNLKNPKNALLYFLQVLFFAGLGFSIYLFLPIRSFRQPLLDWEDPQTLERFLGVITRARYGMFQLAQGSGADLSFLRIWNRTLFFAGQFFRQTSLAVFVVLMAGFVLVFMKRKVRIIGLVLSVFVFLAGPFFLALSNVGTGPGGYEIIARFLPMPFAAFFIIGVIGCSHRRTNILLALLFLISIFLIPRIQPLRNNYVVYDYGRNILKSLPKDALLFCDRADEVEFSLAYFLYAHSLKKDIRLVDCNAGVTRSIYGEDYYRIWGKPRLAIRESIEKELIEKSGRPVYYATVEPDMLAIPKAASGLIFNAKPIEQSRWLWDEFYTFRNDIMNPGFRGIQFLGSAGRLLGKYFLSINEFERSEKFFNMLALLEPSGLWYHTIALWYFEKGNSRLAKEFFLKAEERDPEPQKVLCNMGIFYEKQGKPRLAEECYKKAIGMDPRNFQGHYNLGVLYWKERKWEEVVNEFETAYKIEPHNGEVARYLQVARSKAGIKSP